MSLYVNKKPFLLALFSGLLATLLFPPFSLWFIAPFALIPLISAVWKQDWHEAFRTGWISGLAFFGCLLYWLVPTISKFGNLPLAAAAPVIGLLVCYLALFTAAWAAAVACLSGADGGSVLSVVSLALLWGMLEWLRGWLLSGFPWGSLAYCLAPQPLFFQVADFGGPYFIGAIVVLLNLLVFRAFECFGLGNKVKAGAYILSAILVCAAILGYGAKRYSETAASDSRFQVIEAAAVQGSLPQEMKWDASLQKHTVRLYNGLTVDAVERMEQEGPSGGAERLVVWPETAMPFFFQSGGTLSQQVRSGAVAAGVTLLFGTPAYGKDVHGHVFYNRACLLGSDGRDCGCYDKRHLVPFGEYLPWGPLTAWARRFVPAAGNFSAGTSAKPLECGSIRIGVLICFESIFPEIARESVAQGANILAVITNDSWFGDTGAPWQHAQIAAFRAVETRRWLVRAANTGVSEIIAPTGQVVAKSSLFRQDIVTASVHLRDDATIYAKTGDLPFLIFALFITLSAGTVILRNPEGGTRQ